MSDVFSHPWLGGLFADDAVKTHLSAEAQLAHMRAVEAGYARALGSVGRVDAQIAAQASDAILGAKIPPESLAAGTKRDGVVVPSLVKVLREQAPKTCHEAIHQGLTSQDVIDTALVLSLKDILPIYAQRLASLVTQLNDLASKHGANTLQGRTRMQAAMPIAVSDRLRSWRLPLGAHLERLAQLTPRVLVLQLGGAAGDRAALGDHAEDVSAALAETLGLHNASCSWHSRRDGIAELASWLSLVTGSLGKIGQDIALMAQQGVDEISMSGGGGSSTMAHKQNPVGAEVLVAFARFNATQVAGMHHSLVHEQERSGSAWTLEWMILPQMLEATGAALSLAADTLRQIERVGQTSNGQ